MTIESSERPMLYVKRYIYTLAYIVKPKRITVGVDQTEGNEMHVGQQARTAQWLIDI